MNNRKKVKDKIDLIIPQNGNYIEITSDVVDKKISKALEKFMCEEINVCSIDDFYDNESLRKEPAFNELSSYEISLFSYQYDDIKVAIKTDNEIDIQNKNKLIAYLKQFILANIKKDEDFKVIIKLSAKW